MIESKKENLSLGGFYNATTKTIKLVWENFRGLFISQIALLSFNSALNFIQPAVLALIINHLTQSSEIDSQLKVLIGFLVLASITPSFVHIFQGYLNKLGYLRLEQLIEIEMVKIYSKLDVPQHEDPKIKDLINRVSEEGQWRIKNFAERHIFLLQEILSLVIASAILFQANWWTLILLLLATLPELIVSNKYGRDVWSISSSQSEEKRFFWDLRTHFTYLPNLLELKLFQNLQNFQSRLSKLFSKFLVAQQKNEKRRMTRLTFAQTISQFTYAFVGVFYIYQVASGNLMVGTLTFLIATIGQFKNSLSGFFFSISSQYQDGLFVNDFFKLREMPLGLTTPSNPIFLDQSTTPKIEFKDVSFKYPGTKHEVLSNVNLTIEPGTKLAIIGVNGAGKTTFVKLLCRFYDPTSGQILINGNDIREIDLNSWYYHLGILFQEYSRYNFQVRDSIKVGRTTESGRDKVIKASKQAGSHDFILDWPKKYKQQLGREFSDGVEPSIGQWQKLALARVFYRNPNIFVLDEPTASLDAEAEYKIFEHLESVSGNKTTILISHRFSTVRKADKIIVIEKGRINEMGSHRELLANNGTYSRLYNLQAKGYQN